MKFSDEVIDSMQHEMRALFSEEVFSHSLFLYFSNRPKEFCLYKPIYITEFPYRELQDQMSENAVLYKCSSWVPVETPLRFMLNL